MAKSIDLERDEANRNQKSKIRKAGKMLKPESLEKT
jgi:hypothetical protein